MTDFNFIDTYEEAEDEGYGPSVELPVGRHTATVKVTSWGTSKGGDPKASFLFTNDEGEIWMSQTLTEGGQKYFAKAMQAFGITGAMMSADPAEALTHAVGQTWEFSVKLSKSNSDFKNVYLNKRVGGEEPAGPSSPPAPAPAAPSAGGGDWDI